MHWNHVAGGIIILENHSIRWKAKSRRNCNCLRFRDYSVLEAFATLQLPSPHSPNSFLAGSWQGSSQNSPLPVWCADQILGFFCFVINILLIISIYSYSPPLWPCSANICGTRFPTNTRVIHVFFYNFICWIVNILVPLAFILLSFPVFFLPTWWFRCSLLCFLFLLVSLSLPPVSLGWAVICRNRKVKSFIGEFPNIVRPFSFGEW